MLTRLLQTESFRLTAVFAGLIVGAMLILMVLVYAITRGVIRSELIGSINHDLASIEAGYRAEGIAEAREVIHQRLARSDNTVFYLLETRSQVKIDGNLPPLRPIPKPKPFIYSTSGDQVDSEDHAILGRGRFLSPNLYIFAGRDLYAVREAEEQALHAFAWVLAATLLFALLGGLILSNRFLGRMDTITRTCRAIMEGRLSDRVADRGTRDEFDQLARSINAMLDRIEALMANVRQISSDIAHDLRTPLTRLRHQLEEVHGEHSSIEDYRDAVERSIAESETILDTFSALLRIGQIESRATRFELETVNLSALASEIVEVYAPAAEDKGHHLCSQISSGVFVSGDRAMLSQAFANLIENAMTHSPPGGEIEVCIGTTPDGPIASVSDHGPGIPASERERVFRRFYRLERSRSTAGSGLGLSLVLAILQYHEATITLADNSPGLKVELAFRSRNGAPSKPAEPPDRSVAD